MSNTGYIYKVVLDNSIWDGPDVLFVRTNQKLFEDQCSKLRLCLQTARWQPAKTTEGVVLNALRSFTEATGVSADLIDPPWYGTIVA